MQAGIGMESLLKVPRQGQLLGHQVVHVRTMWQLSGWCDRKSMMRQHSC